MAYQIECLETRVEEDQGQYGQFALHPLAPVKGLRWGMPCGGFFLPTYPVVP